MSLVWGLPSRVGVVVGRLRRPLNNSKKLFLGVYYDTPPLVKGQWSDFPYDGAKRPAVRRTPEATVRERGLCLLSPRAVTSDLIN